MNQSKYFEPEIETLSRQDIEALQLTRLQETVKRAANAPYYKKKFEEMGISPKDIKSLADLSKLPFTTKQDMRDNYPFGFLACDKKELVRLHSSSGTTGNPTVICHTKNDIATWANRVARCFYMVGLRDTDVIQNSSGYGMFTGGLGIQAGIEALGAMSIPAAAGNSRRQIKCITDFGTTAIHAIPSYALRLADVFDELGIDPAKDTKLTTFLIGAEPHTEETRRKIEQRFGVKAYNCFGMTEMSGPGVAFECTEQNGMHLWEDSYIIEIVDPQTLEPVAEGEIGEMVLTTLDREGMPLLRYRTRDLTRIIPEACPCGRTHRRIDRIKGRSDDMFIVKGVNIFPMQIEKILMQYPEVGTNYLITIKTENNNDDLIIEVEKGNAPIADPHALCKSITRKLKDELLLTPYVILREKDEIPNAEGKAVRVKDLRSKE
ncbi:MAG: phenylacetate--CoA ligase [Paludibacteraceae bacterium]|nr:phenylacetate--CoA ligase [Paludibacteraceae bacterium]